MIFSDIFIISKSQILFVDKVYKWFLFIYLSFYRVEIFG